MRAAPGQGSRPAASLEGPTRKEKPGLELRPSCKCVRSKRVRLGVSSSSCTMSRPLLSVKPPDICALRLPGGVAGRLKAGDWSESAGGASSGDVASRSGSGCEPLSILVPGSTCRTSRDERSGCSALAPGAQQGGKGRRHIRQAPHTRTLGAEGARVSARRLSELRRRAHRL